MTINVRHYCRLRFVLFFKKRTMLFGYNLPTYLDVGFSGRFVHHQYFLKPYVSPTFVAGIFREICTTVSVRPSNFDSENPKSWLNDVLESLRT